MKKLKKFEPLSLDATQKIQDLIKRGGHIILEKKDYVEIKRISSIAKIDQWGRVEWRPE